MMLMRARAGDGGQEETKFNQFLPLIKRPLSRRRRVGTPHFRSDAFQVAARDERPGN